MGNELLEAALRLANLGVHVFPCAVKSKSPATVRGLHAATTDPDRIKRFWAIDANFNVAAVTGAISGFFAIDVDGMAGETALAALEAKHGALPPTIENVTATGRHVLFAWDPAYEIRNSASKIAPSVDVRGQQGYILMPPSWHPSGRQYVRSVDCASTLAAAPEWLLRLVGTPAAGAGKAAPPSQWRELVGAPIPEGRRNAMLASFVGYLLHHRIDPVVAGEIIHMVNAARCQPPLADTDVERIVGSIAGRELRRRLGS